MKIDSSKILHSTRIRPKILFVASAQSSHTHSWIDLLKNSNFDVRVFGISGTIAPADFPFKIISTGISHTSSWLPRYSRWRIAKTSRALLDDTLRFKFLNCMARSFGQSAEWFAESEEELLAHVILSWKPDIIHTFGIESASFLYFRVLNRFRLKGIGAWVVTALGGSDFEPVRHDPVYKENIASILKECDSFIADCDISYQYAIELGLDDSKIIPRGKTPGTGGVNIDTLRSSRKNLPSQQRTILFPKAYECLYSKALPVLEALVSCWDKITPCTIHMTAIDNETYQWYLALPQKIRLSCRIEKRIPRNKLLQLMAKSRIVLAPTLVDGFPNSLYEAMATGAFPIFSPLDSFKNILKEGENILFARNLYPNEIAAALVRGMNDDALVDRAFEQNLTLVRELADRDTIAVDVINFYQSLVN